MVNPHAARGVMGLSMMFGGALGLAEAMAPEPENAVVILGDKDKALLSEFHLCLDCVPAELFGLLEKRAEAEAANEVPA